MSPIYSTPQTRTYFLLGALFLLFFLTTLRHNRPEISPDNLHFGGEYGNIAEAIVRGQGYSTPFQTGASPKTGATSWMPPVYTYLLALLFKLFGVKTPAAAWALLTLQATALALSAALLFRICMETTRSNWPYLLVPIYIFHVHSSSWWLFQQTHDAWPSILILSLMLYVFHSHTRLSRELGLTWGLLGGVAMLVNPVIGPVFFVLSLLPHTPTRLRKRALVLFLAASVVAPWMIRNYLVFQRIVPVKSNLFFDLYQSNYLDEDGILDVQTFLDFHPYSNEAAFQKYASLGERDFMEKYREDFVKELRESPGVLLDKSLNRFVAIFFRFPVYFTTNELSGWSGKVKALTYALPFLLSIHLLWMQRRRRVPVVTAVLIMHFLYLLPYLVVGYYRRYRLPLVPVFSMIYFYSVVFAFERWVPTSGRRVVGRALDWFRRYVDMSGREI